MRQTKPLCLYRLKALRHLTLYTEAYQEVCQNTQYRYTWLIEHGFVYLDVRAGQRWAELTDAGRRAVEQARFILLIPFWQAWQKESRR